jgi:hypothetical protein
MKKKNGESGRLPPATSAISGEKTAQENFRMGTAARCVPFAVGCPIPSGFWKGP